MKILLVVLLAKARRAWLGAADQANIVLARKARCWLRMPAPGIWSWDIAGTIHRRNGSIWISWNKEITIRMLAGWCLCRCSSVTIFCRR